jgi:hypothetical protein
MIVRCLLLMRARGLPSRQASKKCTHKQRANTSSRKPLETAGVDPQIKAFTRLSSAEVLAGLIQQVRQQQASRQPWSFTGK